MKRIVAFLIVFLTFSTSTLAQQLTPSELDFVFEHSDTLELAYLSDTEMQQTKGAWVNFAIGAGLNAAWQGGWYTVGYLRGNYNWNTRNFISNMTTGAMIGGTFGAFGRIASGGVSFIRGFGANIWQVNSAVLNAGVNAIWRR